VRQCGEACNPTGVLLRLDAVCDSAQDENYEPPACCGISLLVQAIARVSILRRRRLARGIIVAFLALATISLSILNRPTTEKSFISAGITVLGFVLKAVGVYLLFTGRSKEWFAANSSRVSSQPRTTPFMLEVM